MGIRKILRRRRRRLEEPPRGDIRKHEKGSVPTPPEPDEEWTTLRHSGPWFETIDREIPLEEMIEYYRRVPEGYKNSTFWSNSPFSKKEIREHIPRGGFRKTKPSEDARHSICEINGNRVLVDSWKMEPPGVFLGRGEHPLRGCFRRRIVPEDVTLNLDENAPVPGLPRGRKWGGVVHQPYSSWLWTWVDPLLGKTKYVYPHPSSGGHVQREIEKFETARELKAIVRSIRSEYRRILRGWNMESPLNLETALILLLIDQLGIRIGNPGSQTGASTLLRENITLHPERRKIRVRFVGKDSIQYDQEILAEDFVLNALRKIRPDHPQSPYFPNTSSREINAYLHSINPKLKAKVFRTYNASEIFQEGLIKKTRGGLNPTELVGVFRAVNLDVARFCNHRRVGVIIRSRETYSPKTSITNYVDPRIVYAWSKKYSVPIERIYSKNLIQRFRWASKTDQHFVW